MAADTEREGFSTAEWEKHGTDTPDLRHFFGMASSSPARRGYVETRALPAGPVSSKPHAQAPPWLDPPFVPYNITIDGNLTVFDDGSGNNQYGIVTARQFVGGGMTGLLPSGDPTGATDAANIQGLVNLTAAGNVPRLGPGTFLVNATTVLPSGGGIYGTRDSAPPASFRDTSSPAPAIVKAVAPMQAVFSDAGYTGSAGNPAPSGDIEIAGIDIDCNGQAQVGIALITQASAIVNCRIRNSLSHSILLTDTSFAGNTTTGGAQSALNENYVRDNRIYNPGGNGIYVQSLSGGLGTDGYCIGNVVDGNFASAGTGIALDQAGDWKILYNHVYAMPADAFHVFRMAGGTVYAFNFADNFGTASVAATAYFGHKLQAAPFGSATIVGNTASAKEALGGAAGNFTYYSLAAQGTGQTNDAWFAGNSARQITATGGTHTAYSFNGGTGGSMTVRGITSPLMEQTVASGYVAAVPAIANGVTFPDFRGSVTAYGAIGNPASTTSASLIMGGLNLAFTPQLTGKVKVTLYGGGTAVTASTGGKMGIRYATSAFTAGNPVSGTTVGKDQPMWLANTSNPSPFNLSSVVSGLTPGTQYFFDLTYAGNGTNGNAPVNLWAMIEEVP